MRRVGCAGAEVLDVTQGFVEQRRHVRVVESVDHMASVAATQDESEVSQDPQLMGDGGLLHLHRDGEVPDGARTLAQASEDADATWRR
jgi:hypothetical protein